MYQVWIGVGYLGVDPVMRFTQQGKAVTDLRMAVSGYDDTTMWVDITAWGDLAENCNQYLNKGSLILVLGRMEYDKATGRPETYVSKKDNQTYAKFTVTARDVKFLLTNKDNGNKAPAHAQQKAPWE
jgi:single-strand DNA-binding protein